ncbi:tryptophan synthase subunit alpha [Lactiplantibacillus daowaiensis]|uniref:Tryptophan synthase alpha chain n=1 Tax=Lactiplantibacillus daowaiensis TaxID=2559918 RepID=A0ABW1RXD5_9LACO|nr:tryptophan synthase subunit alpha [Lactiplantibacillus daowaiensis]
MKTKLTVNFKHEPALLSTVVAGDPNFEQTVSQVVTLAQAGCDLVILAVPFSDPVADGPVVQAADERALKAGTTPAQVFAMVAAIRQQTTMPIVLSAYANLLYQYGYAAFAAKCQALAIGGVIVPDLPLEEQGELQPTLAAQGIALMPQVGTTTTPKRAQAIAAAATGFIEVLATPGQAPTVTSTQPVIAALRAVTELPIVILSETTTVAATELATVADGVVIGSTMVQLIATQSSVLSQLTAMTKALRQALDASHH